MLKNKKHSMKQKKLLMSVFGIILVIFLVLFGSSLFFKKDNLDNNEKLSISEEDFKEIVINFLKAKQERDFEEAKLFLSPELAKGMSQQDFVGTSNPRMGRFEIIKIEMIPSEEACKVVARTYQEYTGEGEIGYSDDSYYLRLFNGKYLIGEIEQGEYVSLEDISWDDFLPSIRDMAEDMFSDIQVGDSFSIWEEEDVTGDGLNEALVYVGQGGAYTSYLTLVRLENDQPVIAEFKKKDNSISSVIFLEGASVMNGETVSFSPEENIVYSGHWSKNTTGSLSDCSVEAYQWNDGTQLFEFSQVFSDEIKDDYCQALDVQ
jgi:hypothetical protein